MIPKASQQHKRTFQQPWIRNQGNRKKKIDINHNIFVPLEKKWMEAAEYPENKIQTA